MIWNYYVTTNICMFILIENFITGGHKARPYNLFAFTDYLLLLPPDFFSVAQVR